MTNEEFSKSYLLSAKSILNEAESLFKEGIWHLVVRRSQEAVELGLKALLRNAGIEVPRIHDVGAILRKHSNRFSNLPIDRMVAISRRLREEREISFYGDEMTDSPPETLYDKKDAEDALKDAKWILSLIAK